MRHALPLRLAALFALCLVGFAAQARDLVELSVRDLDNGQMLPLYRHGGDAHVAGTPGHRYAVTLENRSAERVLVVLSVDGVNAVTGQNANPNQSGYVLGPWQRTEVRGWRKNLSEIAEFVFTDLPDSYAARTGRPANVGVIGIAVFRERAPIRHVPSISKEAPAPQASRSADALAKAAPQTRQELGTGHGDRRHDPVSRTDFIRASTRPTQITSLYYDDTRSLIARGIIPAHRPTGRRTPEAFPTGFVADPPPRRR